MNVTITHEFELIKSAKGITNVVALHVVTEPKNGTTQICAIQKDGHITLLTLNKDTTLNLTINKGLK